MVSILRFCYGCLPFYSPPLSVQEGWCDSAGSVEEIQAKLLKRQEAAAKRERAMAYALAHQVIYDKTFKVITVFFE